MDYIIERTANDSSGLFTGSLRGISEAMKSRLYIAHVALYTCCICILNDTCTVVSNDVMQ